MTISIDHDEMVNMSSYKRGSFAELLRSPDEFVPKFYRQLLAPHYQTCTYHCIIYSNSSSVYDLSVLFIHSFILSFLLEAD